MMFCPKCRSLLKVGKEGDKRFMYCSCGYKAASSDAEIKEKSIADPDEVRFDVVEQDDSEKIYPIDKDAKCPKCGNREAYFWMVQTRGGDEAETKFMKCTKCKHTWRDYK